jgi:hypothetical protein
MTQYKVLICLLPNCYKLAVATYDVVFIIEHRKHSKFCWMLTSCCMHASFDF